MRLEGERDTHDTEEDFRKREIQMIQKKTSGRERYR
jgi:hypothetical protein